MRFVLGFLSGLLGMLAGWAGLAALIIAISGPGGDGGTAMGAFFQIGPFGGLIGFIAGIWLFGRIGIVRDKAPPAEHAAIAGPPRTRISRSVAILLVVITGALAWWGWYELIRSPYLTHGYMTLALQFRLPPGMSSPQSSDDVHIEVTEGQNQAIVSLSNRWRGHDGERQVILATASLSYKASQRNVTLTLPGMPEQIWRLDLSSDPDPTPGYSDWRRPAGKSEATIEMNFRLSADR
jgi:hypothetical protein